MSELVIHAVLAGAAQGCWSALDLGSGAGKYPAPVPQWLTIDAFEKAPSKGHMIAPLLEALPTLKDKSVDLVYALDVIEHLWKQDGWALLDHMERVARRRVLVFTPNGFMKQESENSWMVHRSGWTADEFRSRGYLTGVMDFDYGHGDGMQPNKALWAFRQVCS